ncbi:lysis protein [Pseudomonas alkylphenolica]|uniref:Lysis protein n=1 Tax=Pseudomonas alkylphenolica TaxID=237609 RepID=A0A443ZH34_9PSED|nr:lysis system i-spanin subunit Rz [Pseudomonas alkylphenolica]RWU18120.1 lysis protein [Pseudomonas alkylphenolica]
MKALNWQAPVLALLLGLALGGWVAWQWQANSYGRTLADQAADHQKEREVAATAAIDRIEQEQIQRRSLEDRLQANDQTHYQELRDAQQSQARLRDRLATADLRLSVLLDSTAPGSGCGVPTTTDSSGMVHGALRGNIDSAHARRIVSITDYGDQGLIALKACQAYVRTIAR